ncbi:MAG: O-antigen ligase family protein [Actinobacteria bacterium]|nr:O-antigen ligase family protein [Actinomycetota bacterium]
MVTISTTLARDPKRFWGFNFNESLIIGFVALYPLLANPFASPVFGLPKLTFLKLTAAAIAIAWLVRVARKGYFELPKSSLTLPLLAFFSITILSGIQSVHPLTSLNGQYGRWEGLTTTATYLILFAAAYGIAKDKAKHRPVTLAIIGSAVVVSLIALVEYFWTNPYLLVAKVYCAAGFGEPNQFEAARSMASFGNATFLAAYLGMVLPLIASGLLASKRHIAPKPLLYAALFTVATSLMFTFGRGAWLGAAAGIALTGALQRKHLWASRHVIAIALLLVIAGVTIVQFSAGSYTVGGRLASILSIEGSTLTRVQMWESSLPLVAERPFLGAGPDTFKYVFGKYKPEGWVEHISDPLVDKAHNEFLQLAVTTGLAGLGAYLWVLVAFAWAGIVRIRKLEEDNGAWPAAGAMGAALSFAIHLQFNFSHFSVSPFFWIAVGLTAGVFEASAPRKTFMLNISAPAQAATLSLLAIAALSLAILSTAPLMADIQFAKGRELLAQHKPEPALARFESAIGINGLEPTYHVSLGETMLRLGTSKNSGRHINRGIAAFEQARKLNPSDEQVYFRAGAALLEAGRGGRHALLRQVITQHELGLALNPVMVDAYIDIGVAHAYLNEIDEAIGAWQDALQIAPANDRAYFNLGWAYEQKGDEGRAKDAYLKAYQSNSKMTEAKDAYDRL